MGVMATGKKILSVRNFDFSGFLTQVEFRIISIMLKKLSIKSLKTYKTSYKPSEISNMIFERFLQKLK